jgi:uncharacterized protein (TIGR02117 family)
MNRPAVLLCVAFAIALGGCAVPAPLDEAPLDQAPLDQAPRTRSVQVVGDGWHTAIVVERSAVVESGLLPEAGDFPEAAFLEFGWGDRAYYPARDKTLAMTFAAAFVATPAVMHVAGLPRAPDQAADGREIVPVELTEGGFRRLLQGLADGFVRPRDGRAAAVAPGLYRDSRFYEAHGEFHLLNTCNTWTARILRTGGLALSPSGVVTADDLMARLRDAVAAPRLGAGPAHGPAAPPLRRPPRFPRGSPKRGGARRVVWKALSAIPASERRPS